MPVHLVATAGPLNGRKFTFDNHDTFLFQRSKTINPKVAENEKCVSHIQFMLEINPPRCRLVDMGNPSGTFVNGKRVAAVELRHFDEIKAGHAYFRVEIPDAADASAEPKAAAHGMPQIPGYRMVCELGLGPLGAVYQAVRDDGRVVAMKTITPAVEPDSRLVKRFLEDVTATWELNHPNIVSLDEVGAENGTFWFTMDRVVGTDLAQLLKERGKLDEVSAVRITLNILSALQHAHDQGLGHSDLKLSNVFLDEKANGKRTVRVADFGIARAYAVTPVSGLTLTDHNAGTWDFVAPEQITEFREVTATADQFSAAAILYHLLTGKSLYSGGLGVHPLGQILNGAVVSLRQRRHEIQQELAAVVETALSLEPDDRYPDVGTFAEALLPFAS